jgi:hypothetical protein
MWNKYEFSLLQYISVCHTTWEIKKHYMDAERWLAINKLYEVAREKKCNSDNPPWLGDLAFHSSHRSVLLAKMPLWYGQFGWTEKPAVKNDKGKWPYVWPVKAD